MEDTRTLQIAIVAPVHIQPSKEWVRSLESITEGKDNVKVIIVDDSDGKVELPRQWEVYDYEAQRAELGDDLYERFEKFHKSAACKNFGHFIAWRDGADIIIGLDSDCIVPPNFISKHVEALMKRVGGWVNPLKNTRWYSRGYPFQERDLPVVANMGLWNGELDLYGVDRIENPQEQTKDPMLKADHETADGFIPFSGMNWAAWSSAIPGLMFLPNFDYEHASDRVYHFTRHDDIWGGYIFQKLMANRNERMTYGEPVVFHDTIVDPEKDKEDEVAMIQFESSFLNAVDQVAAQLEWGMYDDMYEGFVRIASKDWKGTEWEALIEPMKLWVDLINSVYEKKKEDTNEEEDEATDDSTDNA